MLDEIGIIYGNGCWVLENVEEAIMGGFREMIFWLTKFSEFIFMQQMKDYIR